MLISQLSKGFGKEKKTVWYVKLCIVDECALLVLLLLSNVKEIYDLLHYFTFTVQVLMPELIP